MIVANILSARGLPPLGLFSWTPFGLSVLVAGIAFMVLGRGLLSKQPTAEDARTRAPSAYDLLDAYGLTSRWHRLQVPAGSPLIGRSVAELRSLYDRFGVIPIGFEKHAEGKTKYLPALPETIFESGDAIFVIVGEEQAQQLIETQQLIELPRLDERQAREALQELGVAEAIQRSMIVMACVAPAGTFCLLHLYRGSAALTPQPDAFDSERIIAVCLSSFFLHDRGSELNADSAESFSPARCFTCAPARTRSHRLIWALFACYLGCA